MDRQHNKNRSRDDIKRLVDLPLVDSTSITFIWFELASIFGEWDNRLSHKNVLNCNEVNVLEFLSDLYMEDSIS